MKILLGGYSNQLGKAIGVYLSQPPYEVEFVERYEVLKQKAAAASCIVLDLDLSDQQDFHLIQEVKQVNRQTGLIITSSQNTLETKIKALYKGADDFLGRPFDLEELAARIFALMRRCTTENKAILMHRELQIDLLAKTVCVNNQLLNLTKKEMELLLYFLEHKNRVVTKGMLQEYLSMSFTHLNGSSDIIYAHIKNLKKKMSEAGCRNYLNTIYGVGYKWEE